MLLSTIKHLPTVLPLIPLHGAILMPRAALPIPILENDYLSLIGHVPRDHSYIGVVQPLIENNKQKDIDHSQSFFKTGCAGRIVDIIEPEEGHFIITLYGECRFDLIEEIEHEQAYSTASVDYERYSMDLVDEIDFALDRTRLIHSLKPYFQIVDISPNWDEIQRISNEKLITALTMVCPLQANEKQAILETPSLQEQSTILQALIEHTIIERSYANIRSEYVH